LRKHTSNLSLRLTHSSNQAHQRQHEKKAIIKRKKCTGATLVLSILIRIDNKNVQYFKWLKSPNLRFKLLGQIGQIIERSISSTGATPRHKLDAI
jgi:hypothetical protein